MGAKQILRGTFRFSIVVAALVAAYSAYSTFRAYTTYMQDSFTRDWDLKFTLKCASNLSDATLAEHSNSYGLINLSAVGCSSKPEYLASRAEIVAATDPQFSQKLEADRQRFAPPMFDRFGTPAVAVLAFVIVNLIGLFIVAVLATIRWVIAGYRRPVTLGEILEQALRNDR